MRYRMENSCGEEPSPHLVHFLTRASISLSFPHNRRAHDQVMQAASQLIPDEARNQFHMLIGTRILMNTPESELETTIFDILGHMNKAIQLIQFPDQKYEVSQPKPSLSSLVATHY